MKNIIRAPDADLTMAVTMEHLEMPEDLESRLAQEGISLIPAMLCLPGP